jgi:ferritin
MLSSKMQKALNDQINAELFSSYLYLAMAADMTAKNLDGVGHWFEVQAEEEHGHAMKFYKFVLERQGVVKLAAIQEPPARWASALAAFEATYEHEQKVTAMIHKLLDLAVAEKDHATASFLKWFVDEQVEEEANAAETVAKLRMVGDAKGGLFMLDRALAQRGS